MKTGADENGIYIYKLFKKITIDFAKKNSERMTHEEVFGNLRSQLNG